jgi:flagellar biosynthetic protein FlhB
MRMSRQELRDELKQSEGDPHIRQRLRALRLERARRRMMADVPRATVVITNPTHVAVALRYVAGETAAPEVLAKGVDAVALRIRGVAAASGIPIVENLPLARALHAACEIGAVIPPAHYQAVAEVISYVLRLSEQR